MSGAWSIDEIVPFSERADVVKCTLRARRMFDPKDPTGTQHRGAWTLAPLTDVHPLPRGASRRGRLLGAGGRRVLGLWTGRGAARVRGRVRGAGAARRRARQDRPGRRVRSVPRRRDRRDGASLEHRTAAGLGPARRRDRAACNVPVASRCSSPATRPNRCVPPTSASVSKSTVRRCRGARDLLVGSGLANAWRVVDAVGSARRGESPQRVARARRRVGRRRSGRWPGRAGPRRAARSCPINASALRLDHDGRRSRAGRPGIDRCRVRGRAIPGTRSMPTRRSALADSTRDGLKDRERRRRLAQSTGAGRGRARRSRAGRG